jgi:hypothetical protein
MAGHVSTSSPFEVIVLAYESDGGGKGAEVDELGASNVDKYSVSGWWRRG